MGKLVYVSITYGLYKSKIDGQIGAWRKKGYDCDLLSIEYLKYQYDIVFYENASESNRTVCLQTKSRKEAMNYIFNYLLVNFNSQDTLIYIRRVGTNIIYANNFFKKIKARLIYEIPTFPIDSGTNLPRKIAVLIEKTYFYMFAYRHIAVIPACIQKMPKYLPKKYIAINNAVRVSEDVKQICTNKNKYSFLFIGNLQPWHGLEKVIKELKLFNGVQEIEIRIFSSETECYSNLKSKYYFIPNVQFCGPNSVSNIEKTVSGKTIGIGGLEYNIRGAVYDTSLKNKDYASIGIPFVYSLEDLSFVGFKYTYRVNDKDFDGKLISRIIAWYDSVNNDGMYQYIKQYAREKLTYDEQISSVDRRL